MLIRHQITYKLCRCLVQVIFPSVHTRFKRACTFLIILYASCLGHYGYSQEEANEFSSADPVLMPQTIEIDTGKSILRIYVGRAGLLSRMGHNHVIVSRDISGSIALVPEQNIASAELRIPVQQLIVDDTEERKRAGDDYDSLPTESDKTATRSNMLGPRVLNGEIYPEIIINVEAVSMKENEGDYFITLMLKDQEIALRLPANHTRTGGKLVIDTSFNLEHEDLGLTPYSIMGGMLRVARQIGFELHIESVVQ